MPFWHNVRLSIFGGERVMKKSFISSIAMVIALSVASPGWALIFQFDGDTDNTFLTAANWNEFVTNTDGLPGPSDRAIINDSFVVTYGLGAEAGASTTLGSLIVGADWPVTGPLGTPGTLNMASGKITVTGGGDNFQIGRACCAGDGAMFMTGDATLEIGGSDPIVGTRENGLLDMGGTSLVVATPPSMTFPGNHWRLGNYGPSFDPQDGGLQGNGLLNVHDDASFNAHVIFIGDNDSSGELRVSDNGSVVLTGNLVPRPSGFQALGSAKVQMNGASATLSAFNLESASEAGEIATLYEFNADPVLGVSPITLTDAINITNNDLVVNLNGFSLPLYSTLLLFDGDQALVGNRVFGTFASSTVTGSALAHRVLYDQVNGDILLQSVPEPSSLVLLGLATLIAFRAKR
jgi:hypothetical protein